MSKTPCTNPAPLAEDLARKAEGRDRRGMCPECGAYLTILDSGVFRQHARRLKAGSPKITEAVERHLNEIA